MELGEAVPPQRPNVLRRRAAFHVGEVLDCILGGYAVLESVIYDLQDACLARFVEGILQRRLELDIGGIKILHCGRNRQC